MSTTAVAVRLLVFFLIVICTVRIVFSVQYVVIDLMMHGSIAAGLRERGNK